MRGNGRQLRIDPIRCEAHGMCAELLPERIRLDDWGYPMLSDQPLSAELVEHARRAAASCPVLAIKFLEAPTRPLTTASTRFGAERRRSR